MTIGKHRVSAPLRALLGDDAALLGLVLDTGLEAVAILDAEARHLDVNAKLRVLLGYEPEQVLGKSPLDSYWPTESEEEFNETFFRSSGSGRPYLRTQLVHKGGARVEIQVEVSEYRIGEQGHPIYVARYREAAQDASDARALRESEERYRSLAENCPYGILVHSAGKIHYANDAAAQMWGGPRGELLESSLLTMVHPDFRDEVMERIAAMLVERNEVPTLREKLLRRDGTTFYADVLGAPITFDGRPAVQLVIRDVTDERDQAARLAQAERLEAIGQLTASVAHDFNNLLTVVISSCALAARRAPENKALQSDLAAAQIAAKRGGALTKQLLAFGRKHENAERTVHLGDVISEISLLLNKLLGDKIDWSLQAQPGLWSSHVKSLQVEQVVMNLASNAKTAMPDGGTLEMELRNVEVDASPEFERVREAGLAPGLYVELRITDSGVGMDEKVRKRVFEQSFTTGADKGGSGLGLATVYSIVKDSAGAILVDSAPGQGTTFRVYFPSVVTDGRQAEAPPMGLDEMRGDETILLIEDQESVRHAIRAILELHGYRVVEAEGRTEARAVVGHMLDDLDLILSDVMLTDGNGPEIVEEVLRDRPQLPVLYVSGFASDDVLAKRSLSIDAPVLAKPFTPSEICHQVRRLLDAK